MAASGERRRPPSCFLARAGDDAPELRQARGERRRGAELLLGSRVARPELRRQARGEQRGPERLLGSRRATTPRATPDARRGEAPSCGGKLAASNDARPSCTILGSRARRCPRAAASSRRMTRPELLLGSRRATTRTKWREAFQGWVLRVMYVAGCEPTTMWIGCCPERRGHRDRMGYPVVVTGSGQGDKQSSSRGRTDRYLGSRLR